LRTIRPPLAELVGTFAFIFIGAGAVGTEAYTRGGMGWIGIAAAYGIAMALMVASFGTISGGHFNPAVTIAFAVVGRISVLRAAYYIVAQLVGAVLAGLLLRLIFAGVYPEAVIGSSHLGTPVLARDVSFSTAILIEAVLSFVLLLTVYGVSVDPRAPRAMAALGIGLAVALALLMAGPLTGAALNPARAIGPAFAAQYWDNHLVFWIGPVLGGTLAAMLYEFVFLAPDEPTDLTPPSPAPPVA